MKAALTDKTEKTPLLPLFNSFADIDFKEPRIQKPAKSKEK